MAHLPKEKGRAKLSVLYLSVAGIGTLIFILIAGFFVYNDTKSLVSAKDWVEHTQEVLTTIQTASRLTDRIDFNERLYAFERDKNMLSTARLSVISLETTVLHLKSLEDEHGEQTQHLLQLETCTKNLSRDFASERPSNVDSASSILQCREALGLLSEQERVYLKEGNARSQQRSVVSISTECAFVLLSLLTFIVLFGFLLRDALRRQKLAQDTEEMNENLEASIFELEERMSESRLLTSCRDEMQLCVAVAQVYQAATACLARLIPRSRGALCMINNSRNIAEVVASWMDDGEIAFMEQVFSPNACCGLRIGQLRWRIAGQSEIECAHFNGLAPSRYLCIPIGAQGETLGVLCIECSDEEAYQALKKRMDGVQQLLQITAMAIASLNLRSKLEYQSLRDPLTGLFNRGFMETVLQAEISKASQQKSTLAVFMIDVDHFKRFNDTYGHGAGDTMLRAVADVFAANVRSEDTVCRYGGEEFAIILPSVSPETAFERAERIRDAVEQMSLTREIPEGVRISVSIGIALFPGDAQEPDVLLQVADEALYRAKRNGRNQVSLSQGV